MSGIGIKGWIGLFNETPFKKGNGWLKKVSVKGMERSL
jgi:hypothetical protein